MAKLAINGGAPVRTAGFHGWPVFGEQDERMLLAALHSGQWGLAGTFISEFEARYADLHQAKHALCVSSGTAALIVALKAAGIGLGDHVIIPSYTFIATASAVAEVGAVPVFVDIDPRTCCIDPEAAEKAITDRTKALIPVHVAGQPANMDAIMDIAEKHSLIVIEDSAQAHGAEWNGIKVGSIGTAGCFSFQSSKNLSSGEGGIIVTNSDQIAYSCHAHLNSGRPHSCDPAPVPIMGQNYRMTEFQAALLISQLDRFAEQFDRRRQNAEYLSQLIGAIDGVDAPGVHNQVTAHAWHLYMVRFTGKRFCGIDIGRLSEAIVAEGIPMRRGYAPLYNAPVFTSRAADCIINPCPICEEVCASTLWISQNVLLGTRRDMEDIAAAIGKIAENLEELR